MSLAKLINQNSVQLQSQGQAEAKRLIDALSQEGLVLEAYLFGSAVHGPFTEDSDLDILIVTHDETSIKSLQKQVYRPRFSNFAVDWIFKTKTNFNEKKDLGGVCFIATREGIKLK